LCVVVVVVVVVVDVLVGLLRDAVSRDNVWCSCRVPEERGFWRTLQIRQHVDGPDLLPGRLPHHGHLCKDSLSYTQRRFDEISPHRVDLSGSHLELAVLG